jgi:photosystem II stability/assembly factor-like uncharacterized protein
VTVTTPPRRPEIEQDRDLEQRVADLEALIEEARRRARRRRLRNWGATLLVAAAGAAALIGFGGHGGGGAGTAALAQAPGSQSPAANAGSPPLGALPAGVGGAQAFAFDPRNPQIVYILTVGGDAASTGHVFKTTDGGAHWHATATSGSGWVGDIQTLTADPRHPGTLYAGTTVAVYKTVDGGRTWRPYNQGLFPPHGGRPVCYRTGGKSYCVKQPFGTAGTPHFNRGNGWVTAIAVDPANTNIVYSGADAVRKSTDGGHRWKTVFQFDPAGYRWAFNVSALAIAPTRPEAIYAIANASNGRTSHSSIFKSTDAGKTWRATRGKIFTNQDGWGGALGVDPQHPTTVYASIGRTLVRTTDAGASWQPITQGLPQQVVTALTVDPKQPETVYAGLYPTYKKNVISATGGIYKTTNGGDTWTQAFPGITPDAVTVDPARPTTIYAVVKEGLARSTDGGRTWTTAP